MASASEAPPAHAHLPWVSYGCLAASMALVGSYVGLSKWLVLIFPVFLLAWLRFGIAAVAMAGWVRRAPGEAPLSRHDRGLLFLESFFGNFLFSVCMLFGVALTSALAAGVIMAALPGVVALLSWLFLRERIAPRVLAGIACAVGGIALVSASKAAGDAPGSLWGNLLLLGAVTCEASYVVIGKKLTGQVSPKRISALINLWGLALVTPFGLWQALSFDFGAVALSHWWLLLFYSLAASMVTVWLWMTGLKHVPAASAGVFTVMLPVSAAAVGVLFLGERFSTAQAAAFALALAGVVLATWPGTRRDG
ncbi:MULTISPECIES: DMT family transporter [Piscinibacter]|uniref:DMT family transporter n=1 Tax=Piscinibacter TaxID=1114981 RepID=UPI001F0C5402|nr:MULTISPECIES: DMT family transporter [Piscinibacter]